MVFGKCLHEQVEWCVTQGLVVFKATLCPPPASANVCNVVLMRHSELSEGINVLDDKGNVVGTSKMAAKRVSSRQLEMAHKSRTKMVGKTKREFKRKHENRTVFLLVILLSLLFQAEQHNLTSDLVRYSTLF